MGILRPLPFFASPGGQLDHGADLATGVADHRPGQSAYLASAETGFDTQQDDHLIAVGVAPSARCNEHTTNLPAAKNLGWLAVHGPPNIEQYRTDRRKPVAIGLAQSSVTAILTAPKCYTIKS